MGSPWPAVAGLEPDTGNCFQFGWVGVGLAIHGLGGSAGAGLGWGWGQEFCLETHLNLVFVLQIDGLGRSTLGFRV